MQDILKSLIKQFIPFAQKQIGFKDPPKLFLKQDQSNANNPLGKTAFYEPDQRAITLYITGRHPKDILRSLGHELVHHKQNCDGRFDDVGEMGEGYAQTNPQLRQMEEEANRDGSMCVRDFEDTLKRENTIYFEHLQKGDNKMSTKDWKNGELKSLLSEAWGFNMDLSKLNESQEEDLEEGEKPDFLDLNKDGDKEQSMKSAAADANADDDESDTVEEQSRTDRPDRVAGRDASGRRLDEEEEDTVPDAGAKSKEPAKDKCRCGGPKMRGPCPKCNPELMPKSPFSEQAKVTDDDEDVVESSFPGKRDMEQHKSDLSEARLREIVAYALRTKG